MIKVNLNVPLSGDSLTTISQWNQGVADLTHSEVRFSGDASSFPHVTLLMGYVEVIEDAMDAIAELISSAQNELRDCQLDFSRPYRERETGRYVFVDVIGDDRFCQWRQSVRTKAATAFASHARTSAVPHVTLAHVTQDHARVDTYLEVLDLLPSCNVVSIDLNYAGSKGRRLDLVKRWKM